MLDSLQGGCITLRVRDVLVRAVLVLHGFIAVNVYQIQPVLEKDVSNAI